MTVDADKKSFIAVSGATGLIGSAVARRLSPIANIVTLGRRNDSDLHADFDDPATVRQLDLGNAKALVHCAGVVDEDFADPERAFRRATLGMTALVERARTCGVSRFAYISSAHVYGPLVGEISEDSPPNPLSDYALAHFASEQILRRASSPDFRGAVFRPNAVFGIPPDFTRFRRWELVPFAFPKSLIETGRIELKSSGAPRRNFVAAEDVAQRVAAWLDATPPLFAVINPVGRRTMSIIEFARLCAETYEALTGKKAAIGHPQGAARAEPFDYKSSDAAHIGDTDIGSTVRSLMTRLAAEDATGEPGH